MSLWKVKVDCIKLNDRGKPETVKATIVLEADTLDKANKAGVIEAEKTAEFGQQWVAFEWRSTSPLSLPVRL